MRRSARKWVYGGVFLAVLLPIAYVGIQALVEMEMADSFSPDRRAAELGYALGMGWLHDSLPKSARNIYVSRNLDSNMVWARFEFDPKDLDNISSVFREIGPRDVQFPGSPGHGRDWWDLRKRDAGEYRFYQFTISDALSEMDGFYALNLQTGDGYYWTLA